MTARGVSGAAATQPGVAATATALLVRGNAIDAVCGAVLTAVALDRGVLLGPLHLLVAGPGYGVRCVDGRSRQPGRGAPRPRGFLSAAEVPSSARVAVPALPAAIATALSMFGSMPLRAVADAAADTVPRSHPRRVVLTGIARQGAGWVAKEPLADALLTQAGRLAGGLLTLEDLRMVRAPVVECAVSDRVAIAPLESEGSSPARSQVVCAADHRGGVCVACYEVATEGVTLEALDLLVPLAAHPVMRGERRTDPGASLACASTIALVDVAGEGRFEAAVGFAGQVLPDRIAGETLAELLEARAPAVGVVRGKRVRAYSFTP